MMRPAGDMRRNVLEISTSGQLENSTDDVPRIRTDTAVQKSPVSKHLKELRTKAGLSVRETAAAVGRPTSTYQNYEDAFKKPFLPVELVRALVPVFEAKGIDPQEVWALAGVSKGDIDRTDGDYAKRWDRVHQSVAEIAAGADPLGAPLKPTFVVGEVNAGAWLEAVEWPREDWEPVYLPIDPAYSRMELYALRVKGPSVNKKYPDGSIIVCAKFIELGEEPQHEDFVVVYRRNAVGLVEATVKQIMRGEFHWQLWPRSDNPKFQEPLEIPETDDVFGNDDIQIVARVVGSYIPEKRRG